MLPTDIALALHIVGAIVWVGGMFAAYVCLRPATGALEGPQRLMLWRNFFAKFFIWVWVSIILLLASGFWMMATTFGGMTGAPPYIHFMMGLGLIMVALFIWLFHGPWLKFKRAVDTGDYRRRCRPHRAYRQNHSDQPAARPDRGDHRWHRAVLGLAVTASGYTARLPDRS